MHDHDVVHTKRAMQRQKLVDRGPRWRIGAAGGEGKYRSFAEYVHMAVAGAARYVECHGAALRASAS
jgi:hypothetical protein